MSQHSLGPQNKNIPCYIVGVTHEVYLPGLAGSGFYSANNRVSQ
jgi:hypothetical protein